MSTCDPCLRRAWLLARLAPHIERAATGEPGRRSPELLALDDERLARAVGGSHAGDLIAELRGADLGALRDRAAAEECWAICRHDPRLTFPDASRAAISGAVSSRRWGASSRTAP